MWRKLLVLGACLKSLSAYELNFNYEETPQIRYNVGYVFKGVRTLSPSITFSRATIPDEFYNQYKDQVRIRRYIQDLHPDQDSQKCYVQVEDLQFYLTALTDFCRSRNENVWISASQRFALNALMTFGLREEEERLPLLQTNCFKDKYYFSPLKIEEKLAELKQRKLRALSRKAWGKNLKSGKKTSSLPELFSFPSVSRMKASHENWMTRTSAL